MKDSSQPSMSKRQVHPIEPLFCETSEILILGSFPSVQSRSDGFFYAHPQNRFWRTLAGVFQSPVPQTVAEKKRLILSNRLALWDVIASCEIAGSSDSSIASVEPTDLSRILCYAPIRKIFVNGKTAERFYRRYQLKRTGMEAVCLPSTSSANASWSQERLTESWSQLRGSF